MSAGDLRAAAFSIDEGPPPGSIAWARVLQLTDAVTRARCMPGDLLAALCDRLKSEATHVVLNTLTALHTIALNGLRPVHDQLSGSKVLRHLERLMNKPPFPGVETAAAQLLLDWAFLYGQDQLGPRSFGVLTSSSRHRAMLQDMSASDVAVMLMEDQKLGLPQFSRLRRGLDFQQQFATQFAAPLSGTSAVRCPGVLSQLAKAAVAASYSGSSSAAAATAASRNTFAAWAERVRQDPPTAAQRVLDSQQQMAADLAALQAAQAACLATAKPLARRQQQLSAAAATRSSASASSSSASASSSSASDKQLDMSVLRHELDKAYLVACKAAEWRDMIEVLVQQQLPGAQLSALLSLSDQVNSVLDAWQQAATTELFWLLDVDTEGLASAGPLLEQVVAAATATADGVRGAAAAAAAAAAAPAAAAAAPAAARASTSASSSSAQRQPRQQAAATTSAGGLTRDSSSYLDLLTGDVLPQASSNNPFMVGRSTSSSSGAAGMRTQQQPAAASPAAAALVGAPTPQLQSYMQQLGAPEAAAHRGSSSSSFEGQQPQQPHTAAMPAQRSDLGRVSSTSTASNSGAAAQQPPAQRSQQLAGRGRPGAAGDTGGSGDSTAVAGSSYINPFAALDTSTILRSLETTPGAGAAAGVGGAAAAQQQQQQRSSDSGGGGDEASSSHQQQQQQQQQQQHHHQQQQLLGRASTDGASSSCGSMDGSGTIAAGLQQQLAALHVGAAGGGGQAPHPLKQLQAQVQQVVAAAPPECRASLQAGVLQLLAAQHARHQLQLQRLQQQHQQEVAELKATAVQRFKELMMRSGAGVPPPLPEQPL